MDMKLLAWFDTIGLLQLRVWDFSFRSLLREYGRNFIWRVALRHPLRTWQGMNRYRTSQPCEAQPVAQSAWRNGQDAVVGVGFCLKPLHPPCPSGRANHDCAFFEKHLYQTDQTVPPSCQNCTIRTIGQAALGAGNAFYIMTSAQDILFDLFLPALKTRRFTRCTVAICRYSYEPFALAASIAGLETHLFPYHSGDCKNYPTWRKADIGVKEEQTDIAPAEYASLLSLLPPQPSLAQIPIIKQGHLFYPS